MGALTALLFADGRLPTGGHAASGGLEAALLAGMPPSEIPAYLRLRLVGPARTDAAVAVLSAVAVRNFGGAPRPECDTRATPLSAATLAWEWAARTPVAAVRAASVTQGRSLRRLVSRCSPASHAATWLAECPRDLLARPLALGAWAGETGTSPDALARAVGYDEVQSVVAAALKLVPLDPADTVAWVLACADDLEALVDACAHVRCLDDIPAPATPELDEWATDHADSPRRLFRV